MSWETNRRRLSSFLGELAGIEASLAASDTTYDDALVEGLRELDSEHPLSLGVSDDGRPKTGELQRLRQLKEEVLGTNGLIATMRDLSARS